MVVVFISTNAIDTYHHLFFTCKKLFFL